MANSGTNYNSAGADAADKMQEYMLQHEELKRQRMLDMLKMRQQSFDEKLQERKMQMEAERHAADLEERKATRESIDEVRRAQQADLIQKGLERKTKEVQDRINGMVPGDIPDAEMVQHADALGLGHQFPKTQNQTLPGVAAPMAGPAGLRIAPRGPEPAAQIGLTGTSDPVIRPYIGSVAQRQKIDQDAKQKAFIDALPEGDPRKEEIRQALEAESIGLKVPAGFFAKQPAGKTRIMFDPIKGAYIDPKTNQPITDVPADAAVDRMAEPRAAKDTSAKEAAQETARAAKVQSTREHAYSELNTRAKPIEEQISNLNKLDTSLDQDSPIADSTLAEQIIKITAGGAGSGVRITTPEIVQVLDNSKTRWQKLSQELDKWSLDPKKAQLFLQPEQKADLRKLTRAIRTKANKLHREVIRARHDIDNADEIDTINKARTRLEEALFAAPPEPTATVPAAGSAPATLPPGVTVKKVK